MVVLFLIGLAFKAAISEITDDSFRKKGLPFMLVGNSISLDI